MILMAGQTIETDQALSWGFLDQQVDADKLTETARALTEATLNATPEHAARIKHLCQP